MSLTRPLTLLQAGPAPRAAKARAGLALRHRPRMALYQVACHLTLTPGAKSTPQFCRGSLRVY
ncbi:hypothetical protein COCSUDRAFT_56179 [Coccomyxa subellipsoidea C-169]|uniref:Uncharacterized protein n=1 Tax=Coccomyxa subellipsoidea (strain C-169) TaxID=574566 RepID=I0YVT6_COCSC|nr:hypothetical protein COCSUDRAFT_56179 [Coccomyxa subellipsoidea C-169]EIE22505.1 hypothetical protein COCSUDRAFT_56179 [Coccomyxa subellipsoidea C-169]|eukprot:XP_005647049.1 hypothetical protein COCSUDRAFT_56179 [Coccomyxa subellipsoidea C-169]